MIGGLEHCSSLEQLHLYSNCITQIENVAHLVKLQKLWLNDNRITAIEVCAKTYELLMVDIRLLLVDIDVDWCSAKVSV